MLAVLTARAAPRTIPKFSAMLALLTVRAAPRAIPSYPMCHRFSYVSWKS